MGIFNKLFSKADSTKDGRSLDELSCADYPLAEAGRTMGREEEEKYWYFLSYFLEAKDPAKDRYFESWSEILGRPYKQVLKEALNRGLIVRAGLKEKLGGMLRMPDLQELLRELGLTVSGKKDTLLSRYIEARPQEAERRASKMEGNFLISTPEGRKEIKQHTNRRADAEDSARNEMGRLLKRGKIDEAAEIVNVYLKSADRSARDNVFVKEDIKLIFTIKEVPGLVGPELEKARINAAIELLWDGKLNSVHYSQIPSFHQFALAAVIVIGKKRSRDELREYAGQEFVTRVEILCNDDSCTTCKAAAMRKYSLKNAPLLPIDGCTHENGCRCCYTPIVD